MMTDFTDFAMENDEMCGVSFKRRVSQLNKYNTETQKNRRKSINAMIWLLKYRLSVIDGSHMDNPQYTPLAYSSNDPSSSLSHIMKSKVASSSSSSETSFESSITINRKGKGDDTSSNDAGPVFDNHNDRYSYSHHTYINCNNNNNNNNNNNDDNNNNNYVPNAYYNTGMKEGRSDGHRRDPSAPVAYKEYTSDIEIPSYSGNSAVYNERLPFTYHGGVENNNNDDDDDDDKIIRAYDKGQENIKYVIKDGCNSLKNDVVVDDGSVNSLKSSSQSFIDPPHNSNNNNNSNSNNNRKMSMKTDTYQTLRDGNAFLLASSTLASSTGSTRPDDSCDEGSFLDKDMVVFEQLNTGSTTVSNSSINSSSVNGCPNNNNNSNNNNNNSSNNKGNLGSDENYKKRNLVSISVLDPLMRKYLLRTKRIERRHSGDFAEMRHAFVVKSNYFKQKLRHRKTCNEEDMARLASQVEQFSHIRESSSHHSNRVNSFSSPSPRPFVYRRCRSAVTMNDVSLQSPSSAPNGSWDKEGREALRRKLSLTCLGNEGGEIWPDTITGLLTGRQNIVDRTHLFLHLETLYNYQILTKSNEKSCDDNLSSKSSNLSFTSIAHNLLLSPRLTCTPSSSQNMSEKMMTNSLWHALSSPRMPLFPVDFKIPPKRVQGLRLRSSGLSIPRPDKKWGGEDAFFVCEEAYGFIGVADGVGEWGELGCNPKDFAEELMTGSKREAIRLYEERRKKNNIHNSSNNNNMNGHSNNPLFADCVYDQRASSRALRALQAGFKATQSFGSSTAIIAGLASDGSTLGVANIGDSSCIVLRRETKRHRHFVVFRRTKEQQHFFNCPFQLSRVPRREDVPILVSKGMHGLVRLLSNLNSRLDGDTPEMADLYDIRVQEGDLVLLASDGVFDNLFDQEIASLVSLALSPFEASVLENHNLSTLPVFPLFANPDSVELLASFGYAKAADGYFPHPNSIIPPDVLRDFGIATPPANIAKAVAEAAFYRSVDHRARTPFARQSRRAGGNFLGGKMDDITVVAAWVV